MKIGVILALAASVLPLVDAECNYQDVGFLNRKWRLSTYKSKNCINKTGDWTRKGFGVWCINIPNNTRSFIFTVGGGYLKLNLERCTIFFDTKDNCGGDSIMHHTDDWKKSSLTTNQRKMKGAYVQCTRLIGAKREEGEGAAEERKFVRDDDGEWFEELEDGSLIEVEVRDEDLEVDTGDGESISSS